MKNVLKRSLSLVLAIATIFGSAYAGLNEFDFSNLFAVKTKAVGDVYLEYELNDDGESYTLTFCGWGSEGDVIIPDTYNGKPVTGIGDESFYHCYYITSVTIPDSVITIGVDAFRSCNALEAVTIGKGVKNIGADAFLYSSSIKSVFIDDITAWCNIDFENYASNPVYYADNLYIKGQLATDVVIPDGVTQIPINGFSYESLRSVVIPDSVTDIDDSAFSWCKNLTAITIPSGVTRIGAGAFRGCYSLTSVNIPGSVTNIGENAFCYCKNLSSVTIDYGVKSIGDEAFYECKALKSVNIPDSVANIGKRAFYCCESLGKAIIGNNVESIGEEAFQYCSALSLIEIPESVTTLGSRAFNNCYSLTAIEIDGNNPNYFSQDGVLYNKDKTILIQYPASKKNTQYTIPDSVISIDEYAVSYCSNLTSITIPESVLSIKEGAFSGCINLVSITIPDTVTILNDYIFKECKSLTSVVIPDSITSIEWCAFYDCEKLESVVIGKGVTNIAYEAFWGCKNLNSVEIPANVTSIGDRAFGYYFKSMNVLETVDNFTIYGKVGTQAHNYAKVHSFIFIDKNHTHTLSAWKVDEKATVYSSGEKHKECTECGDVLKTAKIPQLKAAKPKLKEIKNTAEGVKISWNKVSGADKYRIYRKTSKSDWKYIGSTSKTYYTDKTAKSGTKYYYAVKSRNEAGNSSFSSSLSKYYLADPTLKTPSSTKSGISLKWSKVTGSEGYIIYRKTSSGSYKKLKTENGVSNISYIDKSAKKGKKYTYKVKAYYSKTYSAYSNTETITDKY